MNHHEINTLKLKYIFNKRCFKVALLLFLLFSLANLVKAQVTPLSFKRHTVRDGLSHNFVRETLHDSEGFIWIATVDGLNKYDGYTYTAYHTDPDDSSTLSSSNIINLAEDKNGNIWVGTWGGGICIYDHKLDNFRRIPITDGNSDNRAVGAPGIVHYLYADSEGRIWIGSKDHGLVMGDPDKLTFTYYVHDINNPTGLSHKEVTSISEDEKGNLWIGTLGGGVNYFDTETKQFIHFRHDGDDQHSLSDDNILSVFYDSKKRLWVGTNAGGLNLMKAGSDKFIRFQHHPNEPKSIGNYQIRSIKESSDHKIWVGTSHGLYIYNEDQNNFDHYISNPFDPKSLSTSQLHSIDRDRQGRMWIGTYNGGVDLFDNSFVKVLHYYNTPDKTSLSFNDVSAFLEVKEGKVLVGTDAGGLNIFDRETNKFTRMQHDPENPNSLAGNLIKSILRDKKGRTWIGMWAGGIDQYHPESQDFTHLRIEENGKNWLASTNVTCLTEDNDGMIWASTWGFGVVRFDPDQNSFERFGFEEDNPTGLSERRAWAILADHENNIWVGNSNGILDQYDRENGGFIHFDTKSTGESPSVILAIFEDSKGRVWVGLEGGGLKLLDRESGAFKTYKTGDGLPSNYVSSIEEDSHGNLWLGTNSGLSHFNPETGKIVNFGLRYGLQSLQFNRLSSIRLRSGEMMFGGVNGFNIFHPDSLSEGSPNVPIVFADFQIFNKPVPIGKENSALQAHINETEAITLSHDQSVFSIEYAGLYYPDPENVQYKYRLKGFVDDEWQEVGHERKATYTNLNPGDYVFEVAIANGSGKDSVRSLAITISPPWWETPLAKSIIFLVFASSLFLIYKSRVRSIERHNKKLEEEVAERTSSLTKVNEKLSQSQHKLKLAYDHVKLTTDALNQIAIIIEGDADDRIIDVNHMFLEVTGYDKSEFIGKTRKDLLGSLLPSDVHSNEFFEDIKATLLRGDAWKGEICYKTKSGDLLWLLQNVIPLQDHGKYTGFFSFSYDVTLKKKQEEEIVKARRVAEEAKRTAEEALAAKESFLSVMSHEIRTPLNSVIGLSNLLLKRNPPQDQMEIVMTLKNSGDNLMYLINNILDYNKIRAGKIELENLPFNLKTLLQQLQFAHQPLAADKGLDLNISLSSNTPVHLIGDSLRLNQVLNNLLGNAIKFTRKGQVKLSVSLQSSDEEFSELLFVVEDSGIGISKEKLKTIFTPFQQSENYISREFGGSGLGLSIVRDLVELLQGSISVESNTNIGTVFKMTLPFKLGAEVLTLPGAQESPSEDEYQILEGYRILYVEDVESNQTLVKNLLADYQVECITASDGEIALLHTSTKYFDVILMDLQMPGMSGYETTKAIQDQENGKNRRTPVIAFTAESYSEPLKNKVLSYGMQELLTKPFRFEHLLEKIRKVCPTRSTEEEFLSFHFYEWTFNYDRKKLNEFKDLLIRDFRKFEVAVHGYRVNKNLSAIRSEIHKMLPIVNNLKCKSLAELLEKYREYEKYDGQIEKLNRNLDNILKKFFSYLEKLQY